MKRRLQTAALALYPLAFRRRYGDEMQALTEDSPAGLRTTFDLLRGALLAHARPAAGISTAFSPEDRLRATASGVLMCWVAFAAAGFGFYKTTEDSPFSKAGDAHLALGDAHIVVQVLAIVASIAILVGALPLVAAAMRQVGRARAVGRATGLALGSVALFAIATTALVVLAHSARSLSGTAASVAFVVWIAVGLLSGGVCAFTAKIGLFAIRVRRRGLVAALACGTLVTAAMALIAVATALYVGVLTVDAPALAAEGNGPFGALSVAVSIGCQLVVMLAAAGLAAISSRRGWMVLRSSVAN
jgi:hypothetical protein